METAKKVQTKLNENIIVTTDPEQMIGKYLVENLYRKWPEKFLDKDTGEVIEIERTEIVLQRGTYLEEDQMAVINFHLQIGDLSEIKVSDQKRLGKFRSGWGVQPWCVTVQLLKKHKFLLLAQNIFQALAIVEDYVELRYDHVFSITSAKEFKNHIFIFDDETVKLVEDANGVEKPEDEVEEEKKAVYSFYSVETTVIYNEDRQDDYRFLIYAKDVDDAKTQIEKYVREQLKKEAKEKELTALEVAMLQDDLQVNITSATKVKCSAVIGKEYTEAYRTKRNTEETEETAEVPEDVQVENEGEDESLFDTEE